jgi:glycerophosphoryl diester phosphodiesterase
MSKAHRPLIIAHRGACGYLPEHTLEAKALAYGMGADYLEQDVVATRDDRLVVLHDIHLDRVTDVAERFPDRHRDDGRYYARDFDLDEIRSLRAWERLKGEGDAAAFPARFPERSGNFRVPSLDEELDLIAGLNRASGRSVGIYPEIKRPAWHQANGVDLSVKLLELLDRHDYRRPDDPVFVQCFDAREVERIRHELGSRLPLIQLIGNNEWRESDTDYDQLRTEKGLAELARTVDGIGPGLWHLYTLAEIDGQPVSSGLVSRAHALGLAVHPYTFRADQLPPGFETFEAAVQWFVSTLSIDGLFTDFPDRAIDALATQTTGKS